MQHRQEDPGVDGDMRGVKTTSDQEILKAYRSGKFIGQIRRDLHVSLARIRRVLDSENLRHGAIV